MLERLHSSAGLALFAWRDVFIAVWRASPSPAMVATVAEELPEFASNHPDGIVMINVLEGDGAIPPEGAREQVIADMKRHDSFTRALVMILDGEGLQAASARAIIAGMLLAAHQRARTQTFAGVEPAVDWLAGEGFIPAEARADLREAVHRARGAQGSVHPRNKREE